MFNTIADSMFALYADIIAFRQGGRVDGAFLRCFQRRTLVSKAEDASNKAQKTLLEGMRTSSI